MLLAIDTSTRFISLAIHDGRQVIAEMTWRSADQHSVELGPRLAEMLALAGVSSSADLSGVAVALGPGTFTGLRAGIAMAKGLALAGPVPLVGVPSLDITAAAQPRPAGDGARLIAVLTAGRGRLFAASYRWQGGKGGRNEVDPSPGARWACIEPPRIATWDQLVATAEGESLIFCGEVDASGAAAIKKLGRRARLVPGAQGMRRAGYLAELAADRLARGDSDNAATLVPLYLHEPGSGAQPGAAPDAPAAGPQNGPR